MNTATYLESVFSASPLEVLRTFRAGRNTYDIGLDLGIDEQDVCRLLEIGKRMERREKVAA